SRVATLTLAAAAGVAALLLSADGSPGHADGAATATVTVTPAAFDPSQLTYQVVTRSGSTAAACRAATARTTNGVIAVPTLVKTGNGLLPDTSVILAVVPTGTDQLSLALNVNRLVSSSIRAQLEIVVKPSGGSAQRVA